jgi:exopolysaccharide/PEP-CTERM locus tyrosine autokinase
MKIVQMLKARLQRKSKLTGGNAPAELVPATAAGDLTAIAAAPSVTADIDAARSATPLLGADWKSLQKDIALSIAEHRGAAAQGDADSQYQLGVAYAAGAGVEQNLEDAFRWFVKAAGHDQSDAQYRLGLAYEQGLGVAIDLEKAKTWFNNSAELGNAEAQFTLALIYLLGKGVAKDAVKGAEYMRKAADQGSVKAQFNLGSLYCSGEGVNKDAHEAIDWYQKAAQQGHARAQNNLGVFFSQGFGVPKNYGQAVVWFARAAEQAHAAAVKNLAETLDQLATLPILLVTSVRARPDAAAPIIKTAAVGEKAHIISSFGLWHEVYFADRNTVGFVPSVQVPEVADAPEPQKRIEMRLGELRERRLLPPLEQDHRIKNEFHAIKRVLLGNMPGRTEDPEESANIIMVSSALPSEGKTVCTLNLALALALERDYQVVLIDGDVINPTISRSLGVEQEPGLLDVLRTADGDLSDVEIGTGIEGLSVVPAGRRDQDAPELLSSNRMMRLVSKMKAHPNRIYLFDSTPILLTNESRSLSEMAGQIVFVVRAGVTPRNAVKTALSFLPKNTYTGLVLNHKSGSDHGEAYYYYYDYYKPTVDAEPKSAA